MDYRNDKPSVTSVTLVRTLIKSNSDLNRIYTHCQHRWRDEGNGWDGCILNVSLMMTTLSRKIVMKESFDGSIGIVRNYNALINCKKRTWKCCNKSEWNTKMNMKGISIWNYVISTLFLAFAKDVFPSFLPSHFLSLSTVKLFCNTSVYNVPISWSSTLFWTLFNVWSTRSLQFYFALSYSTVKYSTIWLKQRAGQELCSTEYNQNLPFPNTIYTSHDIHYHYHRRSLHNTIFF